MKKRRLLTLLPLIALLLSGCETGDIYIDTGNQDTDDNTQETGEVDTGESNPEESSPSENTTEGNSPSESTPSEPSSSENSPSENQSEGNTSGSTSDSHTPVITYSLVINNKDSLSAISNSEDNPNTNVYSLDITLYTYTDEIQTEAKSASEGDVTITSSNDNAIAVNGLTLILGAESDTDVTLSATWNEHEVSDTVNINYTYTPHQEVVSYEYEFSITNKEELQKEWKIDDTLRNVETSLITYTLIDDVKQDNPNVETNPSGVSLSQEGEGEVNIDNLTLTPKSLGSLSITATWTNGQESKSDSVQLTISDSYYESDYALLINNKTDLENTEDTPWVQGTAAKELDISLTSNWYSKGTSELVSSASIAGTTSNVSVKVFNENNEAADDDITYFANPSSGAIRLSLSAVNSSFYMVQLTWTEHDVSDCFKIYVKEAETTYSISITNEDEIKTVWYVNDSDRTLKYEVNVTENGQSSTVDTSEYINAINIYSNPTGYVEVTPSSSESSATLSLVQAPSDGTIVTIYLEWAAHDVTAFVELQLSIHNYEIKITNPETLKASWSLEDQITREVETGCYIDNELQSTLGIGHVTISSSDENQVKVDGTTLTAIGEGTPTVTATWYKDEQEQEQLASDYVELSINDDVKATNIKINELSSSTIPYMEEVEISVSVTGKDGREATDPVVTWKSNNPTGISIAVDSQDSTKATVTGLVYEAQATITATCGEYSDSIELEVAEYVFTGPEALVEVDTPLPTIIGSPDDRGIYVLGDSLGNEYISYSSSFGVTSEYSEAIAVRTIVSDNGYLLSINNGYLTEGLTLSDSKEDAKVFSVSSSGVSSLCISGETIGNTGTQLYILDLAREETSSYVHEGSYYLRNTHGSVTYFNGKTSSSKLSTTSDISAAVKVTITYVEGAYTEDDGIITCYDNAYYMTYLDGSNTRYITVNPSSTNAGYGTDPAYIFYNSSLDVWQDATGTRYLGGNNSGSDEIIGSYTFNSNGTALSDSYPAVFLYDEKNIPDVKGIGVTAEDYEIDEGFSTDLTLTTYPSCVGLPLEFSDLTMSQDGSGSVSFSAPHLTGESAGNVDVTFTYKDGISDTISITINANETGLKSLTFDHTFASGDLGATGTSSTSSGTSTFGGLTWSYSETNYKTYSTSDYIHLGSGSYNCTESDGAFSFWTDFGEEITLVSASLEMKTAASTTAGFKIELGNDQSSYTEVARETISANTSFDSYSATLGTDLSGQSIKFTVWAGSNKKAVYIKSVTFTILVSSDSQISFS